ncbi:putative nuclease HARBI1 [Solenopsis invicta]|uniref:putative nuclease HARBI1 n=1 Tax=Solenopsis invicta TaxID=13686 RepID=UPI000E340406|nr:putative nuclease HARBI1 [Solenopsis invicta]
MAEGYLAWDLLILEERVIIMERKIERKVLRDIQNPFEIPYNEFLAYFRVNKELIMNLTNILRPHLQVQRNTGLAPEIQVLAAIGFFANGSYQRPAGNQCDLVISQPSTSRCIRKIARLINMFLLRQWIRFPMTQVERNARNKFAQAPQSFPGAIGAIDCTYINILAPHIHEEAYVNHHGNHSLNVQAIVDPDLKILNINARYPGAQNDSFIWNASPIKRVMEHFYNNGERRTYLIGDAGYSLEPWIMTPLPHYAEWSRQYYYNEKLCKARNVVERFFGVLKGTWRCLSYQRVLMYYPEIAGQIVNACAVLYNMRLHYRLPQDVNENEILNARANVYIEGAARQEEEAVNHREPRAVAQRIQKQIMQEWFPDYRCA